MRKENIIKTFLKAWVNVCLGEFIVFLSLLFILGVIIILFDKIPFWRWVLTYGITWALFITRYSIKYINWRKIR